MDENPYRSPEFGGIEEQGFTLIEAMLLFPFVTVLSLFLISPVESVILWCYGKKSTTEMVDALGLTIYSCCMIFSEIVLLLLHGDKIWRLTH